MSKEFKKQILGAKIVGVTAEDVAWTKEEITGFGCKIYIELDSGLVLEFWCSEWGRIKLERKEASK